MHGTECWLLKKDDEQKIWLTEISGWDEQEELHAVSANNTLDSWATVCKTLRPMLSDRCLSVLYVTLVYCGQTAGRIKMKLGMQVGFGLAMLH